MNCLDFRRHALADPLRPKPAAQEHEASCPECARFSRTLRRREEGLCEVLSVPVPEGLADRILLSNRPCVVRGGRPARVALTALAAVLAVVVLGLGALLPRQMSPEALAAGVIAHVRQEPEALAAEQRVPIAKVARAFGRSGGELLAPLGEVSYAGRCPLPGGGRGEHIVVRTPVGKVTLILMPDEPVAHMLRLSKDGLNASVLPAGQGSLAVVAESDAALHILEEWSTHGVDWRTNRL